MPHPSTGNLPHAAPLPLQVLDGKELASLPVVGDLITRRNIPQARRGVSTAEGLEDTFVQPLITFNPPSRFYFLFGQPIATTPELASDRAACEEVYRQVGTGGRLPLRGRMRGLRCAKLGVAENAQD